MLGHGVDCKIGSFRFRLRGLVGDLEDGVICDGSRLIFTQGNERFEFLEDMVEMLQAD